MRELNIEEIELVSGAAGISPVDGITLVLGTLALAAALGAATPIVVGVGVASIVTMSGIAAKSGSGSSLTTNGNSC